MTEDTTAVPTMVLRSVQLNTGVGTQGGRGNENNLREKCSVKYGCGGQEGEGVNENNLRDKWSVKYGCERRK